MKKRLFSMLLLLSLLLCLLPSAAAETPAVVPGT